MRVHMRNLPAAVRSEACIEVAALRRRIGSEMAEIEPARVPVARVLAVSVDADTRKPKISQMDTMLQHARILGYRGELMHYTRVFLPRSLAVRFW